jgi:hypothetical protein
MSQEKGAKFLISKLWRQFRRFPAIVASKNIHQCRDNSSQSQPGVGENRPIQRPVEPPCAAGDSSDPATIV